MPQAGFEPAIPMFKQPKTVLALDCAAVEIGSFIKPNNLIWKGLIFITHVKATQKIEAMDLDHLHSWFALW
jgi:hypothetical protein